MRFKNVVQGCALIVNSFYRGNDSAQRTHGAVCCMRRARRCVDGRYQWPK